MDFRSRGKAYTKFAFAIPGTEGNVKLGSILQYGQPDQTDHDSAKKLMNLTDRNLQICITRNGHQLKIQGPLKVKPRLQSFTV